MAAHVRTPMAVILALSAALAGSALATQEDKDHTSHEAEDLYRLMKDGEALDAVNDYLVDRPMDPAARLLRAKCQMQLGLSEDAAATLEALPELSREAQLVLAVCLARVPDRRDDAMEILDGILLEDPSDVGQKVARARVYIASADQLAQEGKRLAGIKKLREAYAELKVARRITERRLDVAALTGHLEERLGRIEQAEQTYRDTIGRIDEFVNADPHDVREIMYGLGRVNMARSDYDDAIYFYRQMLEKMPWDAEVHYRLGITLAMREQFQEAIDSLKASLELEPENFVRRARLADLYRGQKMADLAIQEFENVLEQAPDILLPSLRLAELYMEKGQFDKADLHMEGVLKIAPDATDVQEVYGRLAEKKGDLETAKAAYRKSLAPLTLKYDVLYRLAQLLNRSSDPEEKEEAGRLLKRYQQVEPWRPAIIKALQEWEVSPTVARHCTTLASLLNNAGEYEWAASWVARALRIDPGDPAAHVQAGFIQANTGNLEEARKEFLMVQNLQERRGEPRVAAIDEYLDLIEKGEELPLPLEAQVFQK